MKSVPMLDHEEAGDVAAIALHPAARAWRKLANRQAVPERIETLQEPMPGSHYPEDKRSVYRLIGLGPGGTNVIAKCCGVEAASTERSIYENILPHLSVSALGCYGLVTDDDQEFCWLFLEDAGDEPYLLHLEEHRVLAGHWLGVMNVSAQKVDATRLPDRSPGFYLERLLASRETIREINESSRFNDRDSALLRAVISHCDVLEGQWGGIARFCNQMPRTLVHGDLVVQNARLRTGLSGNCLLIMDWEGAGWGSPAPDLAQFVGRFKCLSPDLRAYYSVVCSKWPSLALTDLEKLAEFGRMFRLIGSLDWAHWGYRAIGADWYIEKLNWCARELADWIRAAESTNQ